MATNDYPYQRGFRFESALQAADLSKATRLDVGPISFFVNFRRLNSEFLQTVADKIDRLGAALDLTVDDSGPTVHVCGPAGDEWLRFDCFAREPHYHYNLLCENAQLLCRIDEVAEGDPSGWTVARLRDRLSEMLGFAGASDLAEWVRNHQGVVQSAVDGVEELLNAVPSQIADHP